MERELRRQQNILRITGAGVIAFAVWAEIKAVLIHFFKPMDEYGGQTGFQADGGGRGAVIYLLFLLIIFLIDFLIRLHLGRSARAESRGEKRKNGYLILAGFFVLVYAFGAVLQIYIMVPGGIKMYDDLLSGLAILLVDVTSIVILLEMMIAAIRLRKIRKLMGGV